MTSHPRQRGFAAMAYDAAEGRATLANLQVQLGAARAFTTAWDRLVERLEPMFAALDGEPWDPADSRIADQVPSVDDARLDLQGRLSTALPNYHDPLGKILRTSLRLPEQGLYDVFGPPPPRPTALPTAFVSLTRFRALVAEARADIVRNKRELEGSIGHEATRLRELDDAVPRLVFRSIGSALWKTGLRRVVTLTSGAVVALATPVTRAILVEVWAWIRARF